MDTNGLGYQAGPYKTVACNCTFIGQQCPIHGKGITVIPAKPGYRIVVLSPDAAYYEHPETFERIPIEMSPAVGRALAAIDKADRVVKFIEDVFGPVPAWQQEAIRNIYQDPDALRRLFKGHRAPDAVDPQATDPGTPPTRV